MARVSRRCAPTQKEAVLNANHLLLWLSARQEGSWGQSRAGVDRFAGDNGSGASAIGQEPGLPIQMRCRLNFEGFGHVEFQFADTEPFWRVAPPVLALNKGSEFWRGIVCGARWPQLLSRLASLKQPGLRVELCAQIGAPDAYLLESDEISLLAAAADNLGLAMQVNASLALLSSIPVIGHRMPGRITKLPHGDDWQIQRFSTRELRWNPAERRTAKEDPFGLYRFRFRHERRYPLFVRGRAFPVPNQVGKYIVLRRRRRHVLRYDPSAQILQIPAICVPPTLIGRAIILCSGRLPDLDVPSYTLTYGCVDQPVANAAATLLGQPLR